MNTADTSPKELTPLELNNIKLDVKHTVLTPQYLEDIIRNNEEESINSPT